MGVEARPEAPELVLDDKAQRGFISWFLSLPQEPSLVRFFDRKGFYSVHGDNALFIARQFYKTTAVVKYLGHTEQGLPGVTLNRNLFESVLRELLVERAEHTVELYEGVGASWRLTRSASPGKLSQFEDELFRSADMSDMPVVVAVALGYPEGQRTVGVGYVDVAGRQLGGCEFVDDDQFCALETVLVQLGAKECVVMKEGEGNVPLADSHRLRDVVARCGALATERSRTLFSTKHLEQDLGKLVKGGQVERHRDFLERPLACSALTAVIAFTEVLADSSQQRKFNLSVYDSGRFMRLDAAAQRALNVLPSRLDANNSFSLYGLMNRARTAMGKRRLKVWLKQPLVDVEDIKHRHDVVEAFVEDEDLRGRLRDQHFRGLPDIERLTRKLEQKRCGLADLCQLYRASAKIPMIEEALRGTVGAHSTIMCERYADPLHEAHDPDHLLKFEELLESAVDLERIPDEYLICSNYDPRLQRIRHDKDAVEQQILDLAQSAADDLGLAMDKTIKLEWHKVANTKTRCLRITQKEEKAVRKKLQSKYILLETRKDGTKFTNKALKEAAEQLSSYTGSYEELQKQLVEQVVNVAHTFVEVWEGVTNILADLDVLLGFAELAVNAPTPYVRPTMLNADDGEITLLGSRHPCVEAQEGVEFVQNDCRLVRGQSWFQIITGPNMGGKSTYIRQVGCNVLMAQVGSFVPCSEARISVRDCIFARVGAGDCQLRGVSTFMAEMLETAAILKGASAKSLVIIDELGRGTSTYDGFGLAWAISEHLMEVIGAPTLFATHFHELTEVQGSVGVQNLHVETFIDPQSGKLTMLYQIKEGACDQSFGIHVAESANFPPAVVDMAKKKLAELEGHGPAEGQGLGKRKREDGDCEEMAAAEEHAREFLSQFAALPLDSLSPEEAAMKVRDMYQVFQRNAAGNSVLTRLLTEA